MLVRSVSPLSNHNLALQIPAEDNYTGPSAGKRVQQETPQLSQERGLEAQHPETEAKAFKSRQPGTQRHRDPGTHSARGFVLPKHSSSDDRKWALADMAGTPPPQEGRPRGAGPGAQQRQVPGLRTPPCRSPSVLPGVCRTKKALCSAHLANIY